MRSRFAVLALLGLMLLTVAACRDRSTDGRVLEAPAPATAGPLRGKTVAILATDGFEEVELVKTRALLADRGAVTRVIAPKPGTIQGFNHLDRGDKVAVDLTLEQVDPSTFDALVLPGGVANPDALRLDPNAVKLVQAFLQKDLVVAAICHAPWLLIEAGAVRDRTMTSWPSLKTDLLNAGAVWVDREVQVDRNIVTSRQPEDIDAFVTKTTEVLLSPSASTGRESKHAGR